MKKLATKLMISVLSVALAFIALGTSTFAWFSMNTTVEASGMQLTAVTPINLLITDDNGSTPANSVLADEDFGTGAATKKLYPASSADGKVFNAIQNSGNYIGEGAGGVAEANTKFQATSAINQLTNAKDGYWAKYTFTLELSETQNEGAGVDVYLSTLNFYELYVPAENGTADAADKYYTYNESTGVFTAVENGGTLTAGQSYYVSQGIVDAVRAALFVGDVNGGAVSATALAIYSKTAKTTNDVITGTIAEEGTKFSELAAANKTSVTTKAAGDQNLTFKVDKNQVKVELVVWVEGQDAACINAVAGNTFKIQLGFSVKQAS